MKNKIRLSLRVPTPPARPGEAPDFSGMKLDAAGAVRRPEIDARAHDVSDMAYALIRVLDEKGHAVGPWDPKLDADTLRRALKAMLLTRAYDDRMYRAQRQGKTSFYMSARARRRSRSPRPSRCIATTCASPPTASRDS